MRDIWAGGDELDRVAESNDALARTLLEHQCDFDMIDDDLLEDAATTVHDGCLHAGPMRYDTVYVSRTRHMSDGSRDKLARFIGAGGSVYWVDNRKRVRRAGRRHLDRAGRARPAPRGVTGRRAPRECRRARVQERRGERQPLLSDQRGLRSRQGRRGGGGRYRSSSRTRAP